MSKIIDVRNDGGDLVVLGRTFVLPSSNSDGAQGPMDGAVRFNPDSGRAEFALGGTWTELGSGEGGGSSGPITMTSVVGLNDALAAKAPTVHTHSMGSVDGLIPTLAAKAASNHNHTVAAISDLQPIIDTLTTSIAGKAATVHTHAISAVTGLQGALDAKAATSHTHEQSAVTGLTEALTALKNEKFSVSLPLAPPDNFVFAWTVVKRTTFFADFAGSAGNVLSNPSAPYIITITNAGTAVGTITFGTDGSVSFATQGSVLQEVEVGETLLFTCPLQDGAIANPSFTLLGRYTGD